MAKRILSLILFVISTIGVFFCFKEIGFSFPDFKEALYWQEEDLGSAQCFLCPRQCVIPKGQRGFCRARRNIDGKLYAISYGQPVAMHIDPVEKKPLFHVYPGTKSFSIATAGCNLRCKFCQNWEISQLDPESVRVAFVSPEQIVNEAKQTGLMDLLKQNPMISRKEIAGKLGINESAVQKRLDSLRKKGILRRVGPDKGGHWEATG